MASGVVVRNDDESASLLDDEDDGWSSPMLFAGEMSPPPTPPLHLHAKTTKTPAGHAVMRFIRSPFAAVLRMTTRARTAAVIGGEPAAGAVVERCRPEAKKRPSLEQLLTMEALAPSPSRRKSKPAADTIKVSTRTIVKEKREHMEPLCPSKTHATVGAVADSERRRAAVPVVKLDACGGRRASAKKLVVVLESLRAPCSGDAAVSVMGTMMAKAKGGTNGKVVVAGAGRSPGHGKTELFYSRPIPMGRRCRVQHLEESPYK